MDMRVHDLLSKALEIRDVAETVAEPSLRRELLGIALKFERLAISHEEGESRPEMADIESDRPLHS
jgi:replicative DNA helicase